MQVSVVVGNPKSASRTCAAAVALVHALTGEPPAHVFDLADFGAALLGWGDPRVADVVAAVTASDVVIFASPTFKGTYTGLLKLFLDQIGGGSLTSVKAVALMLGAGPHHAMAPEVFLRPVLVELGASCPTASLYVIDSEWEHSATVEAWLPSARVALGLPEPHPLASTPASNGAAT